VNTTGIDKMIIRRGLNLPSGSNIPVLDLSSTEAFATATAKVTIVGLGTDQAEITNDFMTATRTTGTLFDVPGAAQQNFTVVPADHLAPGDIQQLAVYGYSGDASRTAVKWFHTPGDQTLTLGPALTTPALSTVSSVAPQRLRMQLPSQNAYGTSAFALFYQSSATTFQRADVTVTANYAGGTPTTWDLVIPDLSAAGYKAEWGLRAATSTYWLVIASNQTSLGDGVDGTTEQFATLSGPSSGLSAARAWPTQSPSMRPLLGVSPRSPIAREHLGHKGTAG
jgi:hypothetical protein